MIWVEGVSYWRHVVTFTLADGRRRRIIRHLCPLTAREQVGRELVERFGANGVKPGSAKMRFAEKLEG